ncbi:DUF6152 family protein [Bosea sp. (in: a-proteobacteria)]|uniref:DUF6152 family protein n=1 Tax=Bosea sp. (in: a-proteobacteria) TaxID=1871050 RepID=UPI0025C10306|nr:DUF6152 family protein [Bosea sp. (in: a-proteobacteria)]
MTHRSFRFSLFRRNLVSWSLAAGVLAAAPVLAHHGWSWAAGEQMELKGTIRSISMAPPHPMLMVTAADGKVWQVDLGNPSQTERSGFTGTTAKVGDAVTAIGNRHLDKSKTHMKAVRIVLAGKNYDMYPERIRTN